jgi:cytochrome b561
MLHWVLALLILAMLGIGFLLLAPMPNTDPRKISILLIHMSVGMLVPALMAVRLMVRLWSARPADAATGHASLDWVAPLTHYGLYLLVFLMVATGFATAILAGLNRSVFQATGEPLPPNFANFPTFVVHFYLAWLFVGFILLHVFAALYHQFGRRDRLFRRMWFGRRTTASSAPAE